ncbi:MAG: DUF551 domain-containing protein, partial [Kosmotogaceae bacterium]
AVKDKMPEFRKTYLVWDDVTESVRMGELIDIGDGTFQWNIMKMCAYGPIYYHGKELDRITHYMELPLGPCAS